MIKKFLSFYKKQVTHKSQFFCRITGKVGESYPDTETPSPTLSWLDSVHFLHYNTQYLTGFLVWLPDETVGNLRPKAVLS